MARIAIENYRPGTAATDIQYRCLETGDILYFSNIPFGLPGEHWDFLLGQRQAAGALHKNISYRPIQDRLNGVDQKDPAARQQMHDIMQSYSQRAVAFMASFLPRYATDMENRLRQFSAHSGAWAKGLAAFTQRSDPRRQLSVAALERRSLAAGVQQHPSGAATGVGDFPIPFESLARHATLREVGLPQRPESSSTGSASIGLCALSGNWPPCRESSALRSIHVAFSSLPEGEAARIPGALAKRKDRWEFPSGSSWIVFTDTSSHACLSGQYALEQTLDRKARKPVCSGEGADRSHLEELAGFPLREPLNKSGLTILLPSDTAQEARPFRKSRASCSYTCRGEK